MSYIKKFLSEIQELIYIFEREEVLIHTRIEFIQAGDFQRARYIERNLLPNASKNVAIQAEKINKI